MNMLTLFIGTTETAGESDEQQTEHIECGQSCGDHTNNIQELVMLKCSQQDPVLGKETRQRRYTRDSKTTDQEGEVSDLHLRPQPAHESDILLSAHSMDHG